MEYVSVSLCCNDERGSFTGRVRTIHVDHGGDTIELESRWFSESDYARCYPSVRIEPGRVVVGHLRVPMTGHRDCDGNIFWHGFTVLRRDARRLIRYLVETRDWQLTAYPIDSDLLAHPKDKQND